MLFYGFFFVVLFHHKTCLLIILFSIQECELVILNSQWNQEDLIWQEIGRTSIHLFKVCSNEHLVNYFPLIYGYGTNPNILHLTYSHAEFWSFHVKFYYYSIKLKWSKCVNNSWSAWILPRIQSSLLLPINPRKNFIVYLKRELFQNSRTDWASIT